MENKTVHNKTYWFKSLNSTFKLFLEIFFVDFFYVENVEVFAAVL